MPSESFRCLKLSVKLFKKIYKDTFDYYVCHNNTNTEQLFELKKMEVILIDQTMFQLDLLSAPYDTSWKLYPPRLNIEGHEIFIDNDLIIYKPIKEIDLLLKEDIFFCSEAHIRCYGQFDKIIKSRINLNTGFFGITPYYDLGTKINNLLKENNIKWRDHCDEEGALAYLFFQEKFNTIPMQELYVCNPKVNFAPFGLGEKGTHFAGLNSGGTKYWNKYLSFSI